MVIQIRRTGKVNIQEYDYEHLTAERTQQFVVAIAELYDRVFETDGAFRDYVITENDIATRDPDEMFSRFGDAVRAQELTPYQRKFQDFAGVNCNTIFRWFSRNRGAVNVSPRQREWFTRWFEKHGVDFRFEQTPEKTGFERLFDIEDSEEGEGQ